jgi:hypothetical protein
MIWQFPGRIKKVDKGTPIRIQIGHFNRKPTGVSRALVLIFASKFIENEKSPPLPSSLGN